MKTTIVTEERAELKKMKIKLTKIERDLKDRSWEKTWRAEAVREALSEVNAEIKWEVRDLKDDVVDMKVKIKKQEARIARAVRETAKK